MRKIGITLFGALTMLMLSAMTAWACTNLATLNLGEGSGPPGTSVDVTGSSFRAPAQGGQNVIIRWDAIDGPALARTPADATGSIAATVTIPANAQPGYHVLIATQDEVDSETGETSVAYGTPARASFLVGGTLPEGASAPAGASTPVAADTTSTGLVLLAIVLGIAGIGLFGAGLGFLVREVRQREAVPAKAEKR